MLIGCENIPNIISTSMCILTKVIAWYMGSRISILFGITNQEFCLRFGIKASRIKIMKKQHLREHSFFRREGGLEDQGWVIEFLSNQKGWVTIFSQAKCRGPHLY